MNDYLTDIGAWPQESTHRLVSYIGGFLLSLGITVVAYVLALHSSLSQTSLFPILLGLALLQFIVQVIFFLHLGLRGTSGIRLIALLGTLFVVCIILGGSFWIMIKLADRMAPDAAQMEQYMQDQSGF